MQQQQDAKVKHIMRVCNTDLDGNRNLFMAMRKIKGVDFMFANAVLKIAGINPTKKAGSLSDAEVKKMEDILKNPTSNGIPSWMFNRRKDYETGEDMHLIVSDVKYVQGNDIKQLQKIKCYKGIRHSSGLTVRGQQTRSNFRRNKGKGSLGVKRAKDAPGKKK